MRGRYPALCLALALAALTGCGKQQSVDQRTPASGPAPAPAAVAPRGGAAEQKPAEQASDQPSKITRLNEDGSETVEDVPSDSGVHNPLLAAVASTIAVSTPTASAATTVSNSWQDGVNYNRIVPAQPTDVPEGQVEVLEFFWYACPHCYALEPTVQAWLKSKPAYVTFTRVPVEWNGNHRSLAHLFYALEAMGKLNDVHAEIFKEIQVGGDPLIGPDPNNAAAAERVQLSFIKRLGLSDADFEKEYHGFNVETAMQRADQLVQRYRVTAVPTFVVNGKYITDVGMAGSPD